mgnify:CR=1 FL=1
MTNNTQLQSKGAMQRMIREAQELTGESKRLTRLFVPTVEANNKANVQGNWLYTTKNQKGEIETVGKNDPIDGIILRVRMSILSDYDKNKSSYFSYEFDDMRDDIEIYEKVGDKRNLIFKGDYWKVKAKFATEHDDKGRPTKTNYNLFYIIYFFHIAEKTIFRLKIKGNSRSNWFDYQKTFTADESIMAFLTKFDVKQNTTGSIAYKYVTFERAESIAPEVFMDMLTKGKELKNVLELQDRKPVEQAPEIASSNPYDAVTPLPEPSEEDVIRVEDIPFN